MSIMRIFFSILALTFLVGCGSEGLDFQKGQEALADNDIYAAEDAFRQSIRKGERVKDSYLQLGYLYERQDGNALLALWHFNQALKYSNKDDQDLKDIRSAATRCEDQFLKELATRGRESELQALKFKIKLLEDHAARQKRWIEELRRENTDFRKQLAETN
jgi:hypothetical protein